VPDWRLPNSGVAYHALYQGRSELTSTIREAMPGLSPSVSPSGPKAAADVAPSECDAGGVTVGVATFLGAGLVGAAPEELVGTAGEETEERTLPCLAPACAALLDAVALLDAAAGLFEPLSTPMVARS
jgi:hypothetical protein